MTISELEVVGDAEAGAERNAAQVGAGLVGRPADEVLAQMGLDNEAAQRAGIDVSGAVRRDVAGDRTRLGDQRRGEAGVGSRGAALVRGVGEPCRPTFWRPSVWYVELERSARIASCSAKPLTFGAPPPKWMHCGQVPPCAPPGVFRNVLITRWPPIYGWLSGPKVDARLVARPLCQCRRRTPSWHPARRSRG